MKTVIGLFEAKAEAMRAYARLLAEGYARADLDILTNDDPDDERSVARIHRWVPTPDVDIYLAGIRDGGTIVTATVGDTAVARTASILGSFNLVNISRWVSHLAAKVAPAAATGTGRGAASAPGATGTAATGRSRTPSATIVAVPKQTPVKASAPPGEIALTDAAKNDHGLQVIEDDGASGKQQVERGRMRIFKVVTEREVTQNVSLKDETQGPRRPISRDAAIDPEV